MGRSRSRSRSRGRGGGRRGYSRSRSRSLSPYEDGHRVHVADIGLNPSKPDVIDVFEKFGPITEVWVAKNPPCFAFVIFRHIDDAERAIRDCDGKYVNVFGSRIRVTFARPRTRGQRRKHGFDPNLRCYQCGEKGHFSRDCAEVSRQRKRARSRTRSRSRSKGRKDGRRRSRSSRSQSHNKSRSRSRSRSRDKSLSKRKASRSRSNSRFRDEDNGNARSPIDEKKGESEGRSDMDGKWKTLDSEDSRREEDVE